MLLFFTTKYELSLFIVRVQYGMWILVFSVAFIEYNTTKQQEFEMKKKTHTNKYRIGKGKDKRKHTQAYGCYFPSEENRRLSTLDEFIAFWW